jgi:hypothetical protein
VLSKASRGRCHYVLYTSPHKTQNYPEPIMSLLSSKSSANRFLSKFHSNIGQTKSKSAEALRRRLRKCRHSSRHVFPPVSLSLVEILASAANRAPLHKLPPLLLLPIQEGCLPHPLSAGSNFPVSLDLPASNCARALDLENPGGSGFWVGGYV